MRNVFLFIRRHFTLVLFLLLQGFALSMLFRYNKFHQAAFMTVATEYTGRIQDRVNSVEYYFQLKKTNDSLVSENIRLRNMLLANFNGPDTTRQVKIDSIRVDSLEKIRKYFFLPAKVVNNSLSGQNNYLTLHRGANQGVRVDMGVMSPSGIVGSVVQVSDNMCTVMSLLHRQSKVSAKLLRTGEVGTVDWDGKSPLYIYLRNIPKSAKIKRGDSVVTSSYSDRFPPGLMVGTINGVVEDKSSNFYTLQLKPATNFYSVEYAYLIDNKQAEEQRKLEEATKKNQ